MLPEPKVMLSPTEYLAFERVSETRHEYLDGKIHAMSGASTNHNRIVMNVSTALYRQLDDSDCEVFANDHRVKVNQGRLYAYPDVVVVCGGLDYADNAFDTLLNPLILIEVLSPSTKDYDRGEKFLQYRTAPSLQEYLLIDQATPYIEHYIREGKRWILDDVLGMDAVITLDSVQATLMLAEVYKRVEFNKA